MGLLVDILLTLSSISNLGCGNGGLDFGKPREICSYSFGFPWSYEVSGFTVFNFRTYASITTVLLIDLLVCILVCFVILFIARHFKKKQ